jgi:hypothetical protein
MSKSVVEKRPNKTTPDYFVRFVVGGRAEDPLELDGVFTVAELMRKQKRFGIRKKRSSKKIFLWYNENILCPPFKENKKKWGKDALSWWKITARKPINMLAPLICILRRQRVVRTIYSRSPGNIVYEDEYQVVAQVRK